MSTLPGGPADKAGNIHEALWGVVGMVTVLGGQADAIRIEKPGTDGAEFYLETAKGPEHWQAKRQMLGQKTWSLQLLAKEGILGFFRQRVDAGESCVFASISDAPELRGLSENAREAQDWPEFESKFLKAEEWKKHFNDLKKHLGYRARTETFEFLCRVRIEGARESTLEALLLPVFKATFTGMPQTALAMLRDLYTTSVHKKLTAHDVLQHLEIHGIKPRTLPVSAQLLHLAQGVTATYMAGQKAKLIRGESIPRQACADIVQKILGSKHSLDILIASPAGGGKSAGLLQVVTGLMAAGVPVLGFRLDRIEPVASTEALGKELGLPESPAVVLSQCYPGQSVALVVDQLDFVSATSGRHPDFFEVVAALADEVRGLRGSQQIHLVMACRTFDFQNDNRIRRLLPPNESPVIIGLLSDSEVKSVLIAAGGDAGQLSARQMELIRLPQNLALFVESGQANEQPGFITQKELLDAYWDYKRRAVSKRRPAESNQWTQIIAKLTNEMSEREELSVPKARMDDFFPELLAAMVSEGVLTVDRQRYGFGHESLFDYCFARQVATGGTEFVEFLEKDEQELFRRAQLRQVLVYLRDDDFARYLHNIERALTSEKIRAHLKLLTLELMAAFPNPRNEEMDLLIPLWESELSCRRENISNPNKIGTRAWDVFFSSGSLFNLADERGQIERWLHSGDDSLENSMTFYLRSQMRLHGDRVAELLEPFVGRGGKWNDRLRFIMQWADLGESRSFFELFLRLLDDGTLDEARGPIAVNSTFWSLLHGLAEKRPKWCVEVAAHWLNRKVLIVQSSGVEGESPDLNDQFGVDVLQKSAEGAPKEFLEQVLPAIINAAHAFVDEEEPCGLRPDRIWPFRFTSGYLNMSMAFPRGCEIALESLGSTDPEKLRPFITLLRANRLCIANLLLLSAYLSAPEIYAEEAIALLADEPERLDCGVHGGRFWIAKTLINKCSLHCSDQSFRRLEALVVEYRTSYECSKEGFRNRGYSAYTLTSAFELNRCSESTKRRLAEWQRKFGALTNTPDGSRSYTVVSPVPSEAAEHMTDKQWLQAIAKYDTERGYYNWKHPERGGAYQLAAVFQRFMKNEPNRFAQLALQFPPDINPSYLMNALYGLKGAEVDPMLKIEVARRAFNSDNLACLMAALDLLASIEDLALPDDAVQFIQRMATEHPNPDLGGEERDDLLQHGINTVRGHGVDAIRDLVLFDENYLEKFQGAIELCVHDPSLAVRSCAASTLTAVAVHDEPWAIALFKKLIDADDKLLYSSYVEDFIARGLRNQIADLRPIIDRMLRSKLKEVRQAGGRLACLARLYHPELDDLSEAAKSGDDACRLGATVVASQNLTNADCQAWCEATLNRFFNDDDGEVRRQAAGSFWHLWQQPELPLGTYDALIRSFLDSKAFVDEPTYLLHALDDTRQRVPETILDVCNVFVKKCGDEARDIRTSKAGDESTVGKLVFRAYDLSSKTRTRLLLFSLRVSFCCSVSWFQTPEEIDSSGRCAGDFGCRRPRCNRRFAVWRPAGWRASHRGSIRL